MDQPSPAQPIAPLPQPVTPTPVVTQSDQPQSATAQPVQPVATSTPVSPTQQENYLPGFKELLSRSWKIYKARWKTFVGIISIMNLIGFAAIIPIFIAISLSLFSSIKSPLMVLIFPVILTVSLIFLLIIYSWSRVSLLVAIRDSAEKLGTKDSISRSNVFVLRNLALTLIFGFAYLGGFLLFVVPGIILIVFLEFAEYALVSEDSGVIESLRKSKSYVKGKFLEVLYRLIAFTLFSLLVSMILSFIPLVNILFGVVSLLVITPLSAIYFFLMYSHLKTLENQPISNPLSTGKKIFTGVILILAILIPIILLYIAIIGAMDSTKNKPSYNYQYNRGVNSTNKQNETLPSYTNNNGKQYSSQKNKFSLEYPPDLYEYEYEDCLFLDMSPFKPNEILNTLISASVCNFQEELPASQELNSTINGYKGYRGPDLDPETPADEAVVLLNPNGGYVMLLNWELTDEEFDKIVKSFRFIN